MAKSSWLSSVRRSAWAAVFAVAAFAGTAYAQSGKLVLYTSQPERDAAQTVAAFKQRASRRRGRGVPLRHDRGDGQARRRIRRRAAEGPTCCFIADAASMEALKKDGPPAPPTRRRRSTGFDPGSFDADKTYFGSKLITTGIAVNTAAKNRPDVVGRSREARVQGPDRDAEPALFRRGRDHARHDDRRAPISAGAYFEKLKASEAVAVRGNGAVLNAVANGEKPTACWSISWRSTPRPRARRSTSSFPRKGIPAVTEPVAILKTAQNAGGRARVRRFHPVGRRPEARRLAWATSRRRPNRRHAVVAARRHRRSS